MKFFDFQFDVGAKIAERGAAKVLSKWAKADDIYEAILEVRDNPRQVFSHCLLKSKNKLLRPPCMYKVTIYI